MPLSMRGEFGAVNCWMLQKIHLLCEVGKYWYFAISNDIMKYIITICPRWVWTIKGRAKESWVLHGGFNALCRTSINSVPWGTRKQVGIYDIGQSPSNILETEENNITITWRLHETRSKSSDFFLTKNRHFYRFQWEILGSGDEQKMQHKSESMDVSRHPSKVEFRLPPDRLLRLDLCRYIC